ncbi:hypothetical protein [Sinorhizobium meliloti]|uniref:hypothetical protein n=1 Tax=Rhizobium meliloti TaxID=382 RepID=UPI003B969127
MILDLERRLVVDGRLTGSSDTDRGVQQLVGVRLQSCTKSVVRSYFTGMTKRGSTVIILLLVLVLLVIAVYGFLGIQQLI